MKRQFVHLETIAALHELYSCPPPRHPLISVIDLREVSRERMSETETFYSMSFYAVMMKRVRGAMKYGRSYYDFQEGSLMFTAPGQVVASSRNHYTEGEGWGLFFHPDLLQPSSLGKTIGKHSFFHYEVNEALHLSADEEMVLKDGIGKIKQEYSQNIDKHTQQLIVSNIELLLNYCERYYDRQFITRAHINHDIVQRFELLLKDHFDRADLLETGLPDVKTLAMEMNFSPNYLSDLLKRYTGKTTQEHIHLQLTEKAKSLLWNTDKPISEIAYELGFEHPSHFTKIFKSKTGKSPTAYRSLN